MHILLVEDDARMRDLLQRGLGEQRYVVDAAEDAASALTLARLTTYSAMVFDVMLPDASGIELVRRLRRLGDRTPILMLTARDAEADVVLGLDAGADDYLTKPFAFTVLLARLRALVRRIDTAGRVLAVADLRLDTDAHVASRGDAALPLPRTEFNLLEQLMRRPGRVVTRAQLITHVWSEREVTSNTLDAFVKSLRQKLDAGGRHRLVHTIRGVGYCLREEPE